MSARRKIVPTEQQHDIGLDQNQSFDEARSAREASKWKRTELFKNEEKRRDMSFMYVRPRTAFAIFAAVNTLAAFFAPILDCDEVFNFWEPTHYLNHGNGFQTWEYSPDYSIRTWAYPSAHALVAFFAMPFSYLLGTKHAEFYVVRGALGFLCAACEARLYAQTSRTLNAKIGLFWASIMLCSSGVFHASVAFLPSSLAMYGAMLSAAAFMDWREGPQTPAGIAWIGWASVLAWPFVGALVLPYMAEEWLLVYFTGEWRDTAIRVLYGGVRVILLGIVEFFVDLCFYRKYTCYVWNIVTYNVLSAAAGKGPSIFGTEPWHYYVRNLLINFNIWFVLALLAGPLLYYQEFVYRRPATKASYIRNFTFVTPVYFWLAIFTVQPHKEERFMYPIYPAIALNAAVSLHVVLLHMGSQKPAIPAIRLVPAQIRLLVVVVIAFTAALIGGLRTLGSVQGYGAPLSVYKPLEKPGLLHDHDTLCLGKEWYRFPSHYHLPKGVTGKFVRSEFRGLLPGEFSQARKGFGLFPGAWLHPAGMNDENREDMGKYVHSDAHCTYFVDSHLPSTQTTKWEPDRIHDAENWQQVHCEPFLDAASTHVVARLLYVPAWEIIPKQYRRVWGKYCLLKRRGRVLH